MYNRTLFIILIIFAISSFSNKKGESPINTNLKSDKAIFDNAKDKGERIFIENNGQWNNEILFQAKLRKGNIYIRKKGLSFVQIDRSHFKEDGHYYGDGTVNGVRIDIDFKDNNASTLEVNPISKSNFTHNFVDSKGKTISAFGYNQIYISNMYKGIDWRIYTTFYGSIKHEFIIKPNADASQIQLLPKGYNDINLCDGELHLETDFLPVIEKKPDTFYARTGRKIPVEYHIKKGVVSFKFLDNYNKNQGIIIDPELIFSTYSGSTGDNWGFTATFGEQGTAYTAGIVFSIGFPVTVGVFQTQFSDRTDIGVMKFSSNGSSLLYATYLGGNDFDTPHSLLMDKDNNLLIFGTTSSTDFPTTNGAYQNTLKRGSRDIHFMELSFQYRRSTDLFIARISSNGRNLLHSTLLGGTGIDGINTHISVEGDSQNYKLGELSYNYGDSFRGDLAQDDNGNVYVVSTTQSQDFPTVNPYQNAYGGGSSDAVIFKMNETLSSLLWSTYLGGNFGDTLYNMKTDGSNNLIVCGSTLSTSSFLPTTGMFKTVINNGVTPIGTTHNPDGLVAKVNASSGTVTSATYVGSTGYDQLYFVDTDSKGDIFAVGITKSTAYPKTADTYGNTNGGVFIQKLSGDLTQGLLSTRIGNTIPSISPTAFLVNKCDDIYLTGFGNDGLSSSYSHPNMNLLFPTGAFPVNERVTFEGSTNGLQVTNDAFQRITDGSDFYLMILNKDAKNFVYGTYFGGTTTQINPVGQRFFSVEHLDGGTNRFDKNGTIYHAVCAGCRGVSSFPVTNNAYSTRNLSSNCNNAVFKFNFLKLKADFSVRARGSELAESTTGCTPYTIDLVNSTSGSTTEYIWDFGNGTIVTKSNKESFSYTYESPGDYNIKMTAKTDDSCLGLSEKKFNIKIVNSNVNIVNNTTICQGEQFELWATNISNPQWKVKGGVIVGNTDRVTVNPTSTTIYAITGNSTTGSCSIYKEVTVSVTQNVIASINFYHESIKSSDPNLICTTLPATVTFKNISANADSYLWNFGDGITSIVNNLDDIQHTYNQQGEYIVSMTARSNTACNKAHTVTKTIKVGNDINILDTPPVSICLGNTYTLNVTDNIRDIKWYENEAKQENLIGTSNQVNVTPTENTNYYLTGQTPFGCPYIKKHTVNINDINNVQFRIKQNTTCYSPLTVQLEAYIDTPEGENPVDTSKIDITYNLDDNNTYNNSIAKHTYANEGVYNIKMTAKDQNCIEIRTLKVELPHLKIPNVITPNGDNKNDTFVILGKHNIHLLVFDRWGRKIFEDNDYKNNWPQPNSKHKGIFNYEATIQGGDICNGWIELK